MSEGNDLNRSPQVWVWFGDPQLEFAYPDEPDRMVIQDLNVEIQPASVVGVFGRTGSGKTTLLRLLSRIYNPPEGSVFLRDEFGQERDLRLIHLDAWRSRLSVVPQQPFLFSDSIRTNVAMGGSIDGVDSAVERAALATDLDALPAGLETVVGERGIMFQVDNASASPWRALNRPGDVVMLDDTLSAVDHTTEMRLVEELSRDRGGGATTLIVSHRISALRASDQILVMDGGRLVATGTHAELIATPGLYRDAYLAQHPGEPTEAAHEDQQERASGRSERPCSDLGVCPS